MQIITASAAKQNFGHAIEMAQVSPVAVHRHSRLVAAIVSPAWLHAGQPSDVAASAQAARAAARSVQAATEAARLHRHLVLGVELLCAPNAAAQRSVAAAQAVVQQWARHGLCSADYIERWSHWLALPLRELVRLMCSDADSWGAAMRQNSPFLAVDLASKAGRAT
jgi:hypothetical protein